MDFRSHPYLALKLTLKTFFFFNFFSFVDGPLSHNIDSSTPTKIPMIVNEAVSTGGGKHERSSSLAPEAPDRVGRVDLIIPELDDRVGAGSGQSSERRGQQVDPQGSVVPSRHGRAEGANRVHRTAARWPAWKKWPC